MVEENSTDHNAKETKDGQSNGPRGHLRSVFIAGAWAFIGLLLTAIFWPNLTERMKFFTGNLWNVVIAFAVIAQAVIYRKQWKIMGRQWRTANKQAEIAAKQIKLIAVSERAELAIKNIIETRLAVGHRPEVSVLFHNGGKTAARNVALNGYLFIGYGYRGEVKWDTPPPKTGGAGSVIGANMDSVIRIVGRDVLTEQELATMEVKEGRRVRLFLFAEMHYIDFLDEPQTLPFQMVYNKDSNTWDNYYGQEQF